jgi:uncharacterized protein DUF4153
MTPRIARRMAIVALALGVLGDILFDRQALGINVPIAVVAALVAATLFRPAGARVDRLDLWIPPVAVVAAVGVALRTDPPIIALDLGLAGIATLAWAVSASGQPLTRQSVAAVAALGTFAGSWLGIGPVGVLSRAAADDSLRTAAGSTRRALPILRGLLLALPTVLFFAVLLASADAVFGGWVDDVLNLPIDLSDLATRFAIVVAIAWLAAGVLSIAGGELPLKMGFGRSLGAAAATRAGWLVLPGATEALIVLVAVDLLFGAFVALQIAYLFGGSAAVLGSGITFSDYAREGYFHLVAVVVFAGLLLALAEAAAQRTRAFLVAGLVLIALTAVILVSAAVRLGLYEQVYGWTELRFYVAASIGWLAIGGVVLTALVVRDRMRWLVHGLAFAAIVVTLAVTAIGPQAFITRLNLDRALDPSLIPPEGHTGLDAAYLAGFGDDAIPEIVAALPRLDPASRAMLIRLLDARRAELAGDPAASGWPAWNLAREQARAALDTPLR